MLHGWVQIQAFTISRWKPQSLEISRANRLQLVVINILACLESCKNHSSPSFSFPGQGSEFTCPLTCLGFAHTSWPLVISSDMASSSETLPGLCSPRGFCNNSQGILQQLALNCFSSRVLPVCPLLPPDYQLPEGPELLLFAFDCSVQPSAWHK